MNNDGVWRNIRDGDALFYWLHLRGTGEQFLVPFICQRCGICCRRTEHAPCGFFEEPNICYIYGNQPPGCRAFPVHNDLRTAGIDCPGAKLSKKAMSALVRGIPYHTGHEEGDLFRPGDIEKAQGKLARHHLPHKFIETFKTLNS